MVQPDDFIAVHQARRVNHSAANDGWSDWFDIPAEKAHLYCDMRSREHRVVTRPRNYWVVVKMWFSKLRSNMEGAWSR